MRAVTGLAVVMRQLWALNGHSTSHGQELEGYPTQSMRIEPWGSAPNPALAVRQPVGVKNQPPPAARSVVATNSIKDSLRQVLARSLLLVELRPARLSLTLSFAEFRRKTYALLTIESAARGITSIPVVLTVRRLIARLMASAPSSTNSTRCLLRVMDVYSHSRVTKGEFSTRTITTSAEDP